MQLDPLCAQSTGPRGVDRKVFRVEGRHIFLAVKKFMLTVAGTLVGCTHYLIIRTIRFFSLQLVADSVICAADGGHSASWPLAVCSFARMSAPELTLQEMGLLCRWNCDLRTFDKCKSNLHCRLQAG